MHSDVLSAEEDRYASSEAIKEPTSLNENCSKPLPSLTRLRSRRNYIDIIAIGLTSSSTYPLQAIWVAHGKDIRSVRNILSAILQKNGTQLNDESLNTLCETEAIVNSRPLTTTTMSPADWSWSPYAKSAAYHENKSPSSSSWSLSVCRSIFPQEMEKSPASVKRVLDRVEERVSPFSPTTSKVDPPKSKCGNRWYCD